MITNMCATCVTYSDHSNAPDFSARVLLNCVALRHIALNPRGQSLDDVLGSHLADINLALGADRVQNEGPILLIRNNLTHVVIIVFLCSPRQFETGISNKPERNEKQARPNRRIEGMRIVVLVSGTGSNLQAVIDAVQAGELPNVDIAAVGADKLRYLRCAAFG